MSPALLDPLFIFNIRNRKGKKMDWTAVAAISGAVGAFISGLAIVGTIVIYRQQQSLTKLIHKQQMLLTQRQFLLPVWAYLIKLDDINPAKPVWLDVIKAVNTLELVAICWEGELIDQDIIRRTFLSQYIDFYQKIEGCKNPPTGIRLDGKQMLLQNKATMQLYKELIEEYTNQHKLSSIN